MANYYKLKDVEFKLANYEMEEEFLIWKAYGFQGEVRSPDSGEVYKFPIRVGSDLKGTDGIVRKVGDDLKFMKKDEFDKNYPNMGKQTKYIRQILIKDELYLYRFSKTVNDELEKNMAIMKGVGKDPLTVLFKQTFDRGKPAVKMYSLTIVGEKAPTSDDVINKQLSKMSPEEKVKLAKAVEGVGTLILDEKEQAVYNAIKSLPVVVEETKFVKVFGDNKIVEARAKQIYTDKYLKEKEKKK